MDYNNILLQPPLYLAFLLLPLSRKKKKNNLSIYHSVFFHFFLYSQCTVYDGYILYKVNNPKMMFTEG